MYNFTEQTEFVYNCRNLLGCHILSTLGLLRFGYQDSFKQVVMENPPTIDVFCPAKKLFKDIKPVAFVDCLHGIFPQNASSFTVYQTYGDYYVAFRGHDEQEYMMPVKPNCLKYSCGDYVFQVAQIDDRGTIDFYPRWYRVRTKNVNWKVTVSGRYAQFTGNEPSIEFYSRLLFVSHKTVGYVYSDKFLNMWTYPLLSDGETYYVMFVVGVKPYVIPVKKEGDTYSNGAFKFTFFDGNTIEEENYA